MASRRPRLRARPAVLLTVPLLLAALLSTALLLSGCAGGARRPLTDRDLTDLFVAIALREEANPSRPARLERFTTPVRVTAPDAPAWYGAWLRGLEGPDAALAGPGEPANMEVRILDVEPYRREALARASSFAQGFELAQGNCFFSYATDIDGAIRAAEIVVRADLDAAGRDSCLIEETTQALGLPNDIALPITVFNDDRDGPTQLTPIDRLLLRVLYDRRLTPGMGESSVRALLPLLLRDPTLRGALPRPAPV